MDFRELEYLSTIARCQNMTRAAEELYVSQPTLSKFLQRLEEELGLPLFHRMGRRMVPTYAGERYIAHAEQLLREKHALDAEMTDILRSDVGVLRVGIPPVRCSFVLPAVLPAFRQMHPQVRVQLMEDSSAQLDRALLDGKIDVALYMCSEPVAGLCYQVLRKDALYVLLAKDHPLVPKAEENGSLPLEWLKDETLLIQSRSQRQGQYVLAELHRKKMNPAHVMENSSIRASAQLAAVGYGAAFVSGDLLDNLDLRNRCAVFPLAKCSLPLNSVAAWREGAYMPRYALDFIELNQRLADGRL